MERNKTERKINDRFNHNKLILYVYFILFVSLLYKD